MKEDRDLEDLLRRVALGEVSLEDERVVNASDLNEGFARDLQELVLTHRHLEEAARERRAVLDEALLLSEAPGEGRVAEIVKHRLAVRQPSLRTWLAPLAAGILIGAGAALWWVARSPEDAPDPFLGGSTVELLDPQPSGFVQVLWSDPEGIGQFEVRCTDDVGAPLPGGESGLLKGVTEWRPNPQAAATWPDTVQCELRWFGSTGDLEGRDWMLLER